MLLIVLSSTTPQNERKQMEGMLASLDFELKFNVGTPERCSFIFSHHLCVAQGNVDTLCGSEFTHIKQSE